MRVVHLIGGGDEGGAKSHVLSLVQALGRYQDVSLISFRHGPFHEDALTMGIDAHAFEDRLLWTEVRHALRVVRSAPCDLMHAHGAKGNLVGLILRAITGIPLITTVHSDPRLDYLHSLPKRLSYGLINTVALRHIHHHIAVSENFREMLTERGFDPQRIHTVYNGIPFDDVIPPCSRSDFFRAYQVPFGEDCLLIGIMARLHPVKDHETFLRAAARVAAQHPKARFLIGGPGDMLPQLEKLAETLGIRDKVHFAGMVSAPFDFFQVIDINVLTSLSESFPYVILEGARFARPTVSSRVGGLGDLFRHGENGFLFEPRDVEALASHLGALCADPALRDRMGGQLHADAKARFSLESMCATQRAIYARVLSIEARAKDGKTCDMVLLGYYGFRNSGDEAILKSLTDSLRTRNADVQITVLSKTPAETRNTMKVAAIHRFHLLRTWTLLRRSRVFAAGGGSLIQDNTSTRSLLYYLGMLTLARLCGARTLLLANGLGPITRPANRRWAQRVLNRMDVITLRDSDSLAEADRLCITHPVMEVTADPALLLKPAPAAVARDWLTQEGVPSDRPLIGISIRKWTDSERTLQAIAQLADHCVETLHAVPVFLAMQTPADEQVSRRVLSLMRHKGFLPASPESPALLMTVLGQMDLVIGMRLHSLIYAANMGVPMLGIVYEPKVSAFLEEADQPCLGHIGDDDITAWISRLDKAWADRSTLRQALCARTDQMRIAAARNVEVTLSLMEALKGSQQAP